MFRYDKIAPSAKRWGAISNLAANGAKSFFILCLFLLLCSPVKAEDLSIEKIYLEKTSETTQIATKSERVLTFYDFVGLGSIDEPIRCDNDGDPSENWVLGQRIAPICNLTRVIASTKSGTTNIGYKLRAFVSTSSISTSTDPSIICVSELSQEYDQTTYTGITMDFLEPCDMPADIKEYWIYIQAEECETSGAGYNVPFLARGYNLYNQANNKDSYYDYFRSTSRIDDYDLVASFYYSSSTFGETTTSNYEYNIPFIVYILILTVVVSCLFLILIMKKNGR